MSETHVNFNNKRIIPAPFVSISRRYDLSGDGSQLGSVWSITLFGTFVLGAPDSPSSSGTLWDQTAYPAREDTQPQSALASILVKQKAISDLFSKRNNGAALEIQSGDGSSPLKAYVNIVGDVVFQEDLWFNTCKWTVTLEASEILMNGAVYGNEGFSEYISSASEDIQIETNEDQPESINLPRTYRLTHSLNAVGKRVYNESGLVREAWENAKLWVSSRLGFNSSFINQSGVRDLPSYYGGYNHVRSESYGKMDGTYSVTEAWLLASGTALEDFTVEISTNVEDSLTNVAIQGTVTGLEYRDSNMNIISSKYNNASGKFSTIEPLMLSRAQTYSNTTLNTVPASTSVGKNPTTGVITYNYTYNNRPSNLISNTRSESIQIIDSLETNVVAIIPVISRAKGPILQNIGTSNERFRTLNIELVMSSPPTGNITQLLNSDPSLVAPTDGEISSIIAAANPATAFSASQVYLTENVKTYDCKAGRLSINKTWVYEV